MRLYAAGLGGHCLRVAVVKRPAPTPEDWDEEVYAPDPRARDHPFLFWFFTAIVFFLVAVAFAAWSASKAHAQEKALQHSNPWLLTWIPATCCVTNDCCWEISEHELTPQPGDRWLVNSTRQVLQRTGWSPDGKTYRCACDLSEGKWIKHQGANTRCVFVQLNAF